MTVYNSARSSKLVCISYVCTSKPASTGHVRTSKPVRTSRIY